MNPDRPGSSSNDPGRLVLPWLRITLYFLASRFFIYVFGFLSTYIVTKGPADRFKTALGLFQHWDANWYLNIAQNGYVPTKEGLPSAAFFPLYPMLVRGVGFVCRDLRVAGYLISNACLLGACLMLWKLVARDDRREEVADRSIIFLLFGPVSFFFSSIYSDSLFLLLLIGALYFATGRRWLAAGCCGFLASLTRPVGILLIPVLVFEFALPYLRRQRGESAIPPWPSPDAVSFLASLAFTGAGLGTYSLYLLVKFNDPVAFFHAQAFWNRAFCAPWHTLLHLEYSAFYAVWFRAAVAIAVVTIMSGFAVRIRPTYSFLSLVYLLFYLSTLHLESIPRFLSVIFPFYIVIARVAVRFPRLEPLLLAGSVMLLALSTILFVNGYWLT